MLERFTTTQNDYGEEVETWAAIGQEWANISYGKGSERRQAAMEQASQPATFYVDDNTRTAGLTAKDRISFNGVNWDIEGNVPSGDRMEREITAVRAA